MIGFGVNKHSFKQISDYIKSWLYRNDIKYEEIKSPHFSIAQIIGTYDKDDLVRYIYQIDDDISLNPKDIKIFRGRMVPNDFIVLEYKPHAKFVNAFKHIKSKYQVRDFGSVKPHISLFKIQPNVMSDILFADMKQGLPKMPIVKPESKELFNDKFEVEFRE